MRVDRVRALAHLLVLALIAAGSQGSLAAAAPAQSPALTAPVVVDGPSPDIEGLSGLAVAHDGTGGLVYVKAVAGVAHVFVSRLAGGAYQAPVQVDAGLPGPSSQPVIAAGRGGLLLTAFINGGELYAVDMASSTSAFTAPVVLFNGASNPAMQITDLGKAYLAFTGLDGSGADVRVAYYYQGSWALEPSPLNVTPADDAGTGSGRPAVAAAGDGVAIVIWGEGGHLYSRRVWGTTPSVVYQQVDVPSLSGWSEVAAGDPSIGAGGNSTYATAVFQETLTNGLQQQARVLARPLLVSAYGAVRQADGLTTPGAENADDPTIAIGEFSHGLATAETDTSNEVFATLVGNAGIPYQVVRVDSLANASAPDPVTAVTDYYSGLIAWQHDPGQGGSPEIRARYFEGGSLESEMVLSSPALGPTDAADELVAAGDIAGDVAIAWVQGTDSSTQIVATQLMVGPGSFVPQSRFRYVNTTTPELTWSAPSEAWGLVHYEVSVNGSLVAQTTGTSIALPLPQGPVTWQVTAVNDVGLTSTADAAVVWVDTIPPAVTLSLSGRLQAGSTVSAVVRVTDAPPPEPPADAAGIKKAILSWGDGSRTTIAGSTHHHAYAKPGSYRLQVTAIDRAGNEATVARVLIIKPKPKPKLRRTHGKGKHA